MALDRFVKFGARRPSKEEVGLVLRDFFGPEAAKVEWEGDRFYVSLPGKNSFPFASLPDGGWNPFEGHERWIEIFVNDKQFDVITRLADEYTNVIAEGLAKMFARFWDGELEES
jgi:hypothetical protein